MSIEEIVYILVRNYTLTNLEERLESTVLDFQDGLESFVEDNYEIILEILKEDRWVS